MPPDMPAAKLRPVAPSTTTTPPVMYSQPWSPVPSTTAMAPGVAHGEALAGDAAEIALAGDGAVQHRVADDDALLGLDADMAFGRTMMLAARQALADVVVALADEIERDAARGPGAEALPGGAGQRQPDGVLGQAGVAVALGDLARQHGAGGAIDVADRQLGLDRLLRARAPAAPARSACCRAPCRGRGPAPRM